MVVKGLKAGDVFEDYGRRYKVLSVNKDGTYISSYVGDQEETSEIVSGGRETEDHGEKQISSEDVKPEDKRFTKTYINHMKKEELEKLCEAYGIVLGSAEEMKKAVIERLGL